MPTSNRRRFVPLAISYFLRQDYENRELIILDDGSDSVADLMPNDPRVCYKRLAQKICLGEKRNLACEYAQGEILVHWDDDDWFASDRLSYQVGQLLATGADLCGLARLWFFDAQRSLAWEYVYNTPRKPWAAGGTLCYRRAFWQNNRFPGINVGEDTRFVWAKPSARFHRHPENHFYAAHIHTANTSPKRVNDARYLRRDFSVLARRLGPDLALYSPRPLASGTPTASIMNHPLVSCIMPTHNRRPFVPQAIRLFLDQSYPEKELIILDDGTDSVADLIPDDPRVRYERLPAKVSIGAKRNLACERARGDIVAHWDDDDWFATTRLDYQVAQLQSSGADLCGIDRMWFFDPYHQLAWEYIHDNPRRPWVAGGSLCYRKRFWADHRFQDCNLSEDTHFVWSQPAGRILVLPDNRFYAALVHPSNTSSKPQHNQGYHPRPFPEIASILGPALRNYASDPNLLAALAPRFAFSLCYTSRRAPLLAEVVRRWLGRARQPEQVEIVLAVDGDDVPGQQAARAIPGAVVVVQDSPPFNCVKGWNAAANRAAGQVLIAVSDDIEPPEGWDAALLGLKPEWPNTEAVVISHDGLHGTEGHVAIVTRARYRRLGYLFFPGYESMYCDTDLAAHARADGVAIDARRQICFAHLHIDNGRRPSDAVDQEHASAGRYSRGAALFHQRRARSFASQPPARPQPVAVSNPEGPERFAAYLQVINDDFCLREVLDRLHEEGVRHFFVSIPDHHWSGRCTPPEDIAAIQAVVNGLRGKTGVRAEVAIHGVAKYRRPGASRVQVETCVRNEALGWVHQNGFRHCLIVDDDEVWRRGQLSLLDTLVRIRRPAAVTYPMVPVVGLPGYPVGDNKDHATIYLDLIQGRFRDCRSPQKPSFPLSGPGIFHFTAIKKTREALIAKMRESGHYDDPRYDFEGWIQNKLPQLRPGFRDVHMYRPMQIWPVIRTWSDTELAELPETLHPYLGLTPENSGVLFSNLSGTNVPRVQGTQANGAKGPD
jgi:glycosyltransferase involved in cell wall biosynthesis